MNNIPKSILRAALIEHAIATANKKLIKQLRHQQRAYRESRTRLNERKAFATVKTQPSWRMSDQHHNPSVTWCENINPKTGGTLNEHKGDKPEKGTHIPRETVLDRGHYNLHRQVITQAPIKKEALLE